MSTMVDNRWDPILQNQQGPITSGYVSNSDIRQRERKDQIKWERQREYEDLMNKPGEPEQGQQQQRTPPVYYKTGAAGNSLPLGSYEESRRTLDDQRQQEYNQFVAQKKDTENKRREELYRNSQQNYRPPPEPEMYDHGQIAKDLREERQKEYNDYLKQKISEEHSRIKHRHRYTPAGGLPIGQYDLQRKRLRDELSRDYKQSLLKQRQDQLVFRAKEFQLDSAPEYLGNLNEERPLVGSPRNSYEIPRYQREQEIHTRRQIPPTPPGGLNIATEQERKRVEDLKKTMYRDELLKQQKEQLYNRATQQGEVSVINRSSPTQAPPNQISPRGRPPPHPDSGRRRGPPPPQNDRMDKSRETPNYWNEGRQAPSPKSVESDSKNVQPKNGESETKNKQPMESHRPQEGELRTGFFDDRRQSPLNRDERHQDYQQFLANKQREDDMRHQRLEDQRHAPHLDLSKGDYYDAETYERKRQSLNSERKNDYQNFLSKQKENKPPMSQVKETEDFQTERRHVLAEERNREYNEFLEQKRKMRPITSDMGGITYASNYKKDTRPHSDRILSLYKALPPDQRSDMRLRPVTPDHWSASLSINEDAKTARKMSMNMERKREYNNYLKTQSSKKPQGLTKENTPQGYGSLHFNEEYSERREIAQKQALNEEYNQYLTKEGLKDEKVEPLQLEEDFQTRRQKELAMERHQDFVDFLEKMSNRQNMIADKLFTNRPSYRQYTPESLQGLPIGQTRYDHQKRQQEVQRNREYNEHLAKKSPEQGRREWIDTSGPKGIIAGVDSYNYDKRKTFAEERKKEYKDIMEKKAGASSTKVEVEEPVQEQEPALERKPTTPINLNAVKIFPVGSGYTRRQRELQAERKKNFKDFAEKKNEIYKKQQENRESFREMLDRELMESPPIIPIGEYDTKKRQFKQEAHQEMVNFLERQPHGNRDKEFWNKVTKPRILPQSGEYKNRKQKLNDELRKDWRDFVLKQEPPRERIKEFGTPGAVLFTGEYEKTRQKVRDERTKDYHEFIQKHGGHAPRRMPDQAPANSIGFMANLGFHDREREKLNKERQGEYRKFLDEKAFGKEGMPRGRPNWVDGKVPPDSWFQQDPPPFHKSPVRDQEPPRDRPASYGRRQTPSYEEILDSKRREEASYRRFEDPEYSRAGGLGGPNDRYD
ncbi:trichohyalin-like isoform X7 [Mytilus californianus]|uniref:trichohyalin-like isoform X7 n=1 Tax=Mytilus californianus TaxID=6549 RepID=UPI0022470BD2|nr:trichohyalin-like isoform X7 [Mytilus californianus]